MSGVELDRSRDIFDQYRRAPRAWGDGRTGKNAPHILFANATTDDRLLGFVKQFGPVFARSVHEEFVPPNALTLTADQNLQDLRNERDLFHSALMLLAEVKRETNPDISTMRCCLTTIADKVSTWPAQWHCERNARESAGELPPNWEFGEASARYIHQLAHRNLGEPTGDKLSILMALYDPVGGGHHVLCELVNAFRPFAYVWLNSAVEGPHFDVRYGIRPILYHILRREYLDGAGIDVCSNTQCRELFVIERAGQRFCNEKCSRHQRQRDYWRKRGKKLRKKRFRRARTGAAKGR